MPVAPRLLSSQCSHCKRHESLSLELVFCPRCRAVKYCKTSQKEWVDNSAKTSVSPRSAHHSEHQALDWHNHKEICEEIQKHRAVLEKQEALFHQTSTEHYAHSPPDAIWLPAADLSGIEGWDPDSYSEAKMGICHDLDKVGTREAQQLALDVTLAYLNNGHQDLIVLWRDIITHRILRLGRDQDAYDHLRWHVHSRYRRGRGLADPTQVLALPRTGYDAFDSPHIYVSYDGSDSWQLSSVLIKLRMLLSMKELNKASILKAKQLPPEIMDLIRLQMTNSTLQNNRPFMATLLDGKSTAQFQNQIIEQLDGMYDRVFISNNNIWPILLEARQQWNSCNDDDCQGRFHFRREYVNEVYKAWVETPGALEWVAEKERLRAERGDPVGTRGEHDFD